MSATPTTTVSISYPQGTKFDMDYYLTKHMPLAQAKWAQYGLKGCKVVQYGGADGAPYSVQSLLDFDSAEGWTRAVASPEAQDVMADVANFADKRPSMWVGGTVKEESC